MTALYIPLAAFGALWALWVFYIAVMGLKRARDAGQLTLITKALGYPVLAFGLLLNTSLNVLVFTVLLLELPREFLISERLKRHNRYGSGWRQKLAAWFEPLLDPFDPSGDHI